MLVQEQGNMNFFAEVRCVCSETSSCSALGRLVGDRAMASYKADCNSVRVRLRVDRAEPVLIAYAGAMSTCT